MQCLDNVQSTSFSLPTIKGNKLKSLNSERTSDHSSSSIEASGFLLCLAFRCAGRAFSSGLACVKGCPGGAAGFRIDSKIGRASFLDLLAREDFLVIRPPVKVSEGNA
jgi:hypothetical protein